MQFEMLYSKIHRAQVSDANLNYVGSITIEKNLAKSAKLLAGMKVEILNISQEELQSYQPTIVQVGANNEILSITSEV